MPNGASAPPVDFMVAADATKTRLTASLARVVLAVAVGAAVDVADGWKEGG